MGKLKPILLSYTSEKDWSSFLPDDANLILNFPCSSSVHPDSLLWHPDRAGKYSVKSGYWVALDQKLLKSGPSCSRVDGVSWWMILWGLKIPSKVRIFCWKACLNWQPTFHTLCCCHMEVLNGCKNAVALKLKPPLMPYGSVAPLRCDFDAANAPHPCSPVFGDPVRWKMPPDGWYKLNVDTSLKAEGCLVGLLVVVRDSQGLFMAGLSRKLVGSV
ncbi:hypothetical protein ACOSQ3_010254 [Xanthoceras sorbifolium]